MKTFEEILTEEIRKINPKWDYGNTHEDVYWQLHHFFDAHIAKKHIEKAARLYASQTIDKCAEEGQFTDSQILKVKELLK